MMPCSNWRIARSTSARHRCCESLPDVAAPAPGSAVSEDSAHWYDAIVGFGFGAVSAGHRIAPPSPPYRWFVKSGDGVG